MVNSKLAVAAALELLEKRRHALKLAKGIEKFLREMSKTFNLNINLSNDTVTEEQKKECLNLKQNKK